MPAKVFSVFLHIIISCQSTSCCNLAGKARHPRVEVLCNSSQGQHAHDGPDFSSLDPTLQQQWDVAANAHLGNVAVTPDSIRTVQWKCDKCPDGHLHSWSAPVLFRSKGSGCPYCEGSKLCTHNSLAITAPGVAAQWDYKQNDRTPDDVAALSRMFASWLCDACGWKWQTAVYRRVRSTDKGCPQCAVR